MKAPARRAKREAPATLSEFVLYANLHPGAEVSASAEESDIATPRIQEALRHAAKWKATEGREAYKLCRSLLEGEGSTPQPNEFVAPMFAARLTMFHQGFRLVMAPEVKAIIAKKAPWFYAEAKALAGEAFQEYLTCDNVALAWFGDQRREDKSPIVAVLDTDVITEYSNGNAESLTIQLPRRALSKEEKDVTDPDLAKAIEKGEKFTFDRTQGQFFNVATAVKRGRGLARPSLLGCFDILGMLELLRAGDSTGAWESRYILKHWLLGYEPKSSDIAVHRMPQASPKRIAALQGAFKKKKGFLVEFVSKFDAVLKYEYLPAEFFDEKKYAGALMRLKRWGGPLAVMLGQTAQDSAAAGMALMMARAEADAARGKVGALLESLFNQKEYGLGLNPKQGQRVGVAWSPVTFMDPKTLATNINQWVSIGLISVETARDWLGIDSMTEVARLDAEAATTTGYRPNYEANQGMKAGAGGAPDHGGSTAPDNGKPPG